MSDNHAAPVVEKYLGKKPGDGTTFFGSDGWVCIGRGYASASKPEWLREREPKGDKRVLYRPNYYAAFVESVRGRSPSVTPIGDAVRSDAFSHLSLLAIKSGKEVVWDPKAYRIVSPAELDAARSSAIRGDWMKG
jgi:hypothetical protein